MDDAVLSFCLNGRRGWHLGCWHREEVAILEGYRGDLYTAAMSADGSRVVAAPGPDATIWDGTTGKRIAVLHSNDQEVSSAAFNRAGTRILTTTSNGNTHLWDAVSGREIASSAGNKRDAVGFIQSQRGPYRHGHIGRRDRLRDGATGKAVATLSASSSGFSKTVFSPDGSRLATSDRSSADIHLWDAETGKEVAVDPHESSFVSVNFSPDSLRIVTASDSGDARIWNASTGSELLVLRSKARDHRADWAEFSPDGKQVVAASDGGAARIWTTAGTEVKALGGDNSYVTRSTFSPDRIG